MNNFIEDNIEKFVDSCKLFLEFQEEIGIPLTIVIDKESILINDLEFYGMINRRADQGSSGPSGSKVSDTDGPLALVDDPRKGKSVPSRKPRWEKFPEMIL